MKIFDVLEQSDIVGIYGPNGSGKTTFIYALGIIKTLLSGNGVENVNENILIGSDVASLLCEFYVEDDEERQYVAVYTVEFKNDTITTESLKVAIKNDPEYSSRLNSIFEVDFEKQEELFGPETKRTTLLGKSKDSYLPLIIEKAFCYSNSRSFIFSDNLSKKIHENNADTYYNLVLSALSQYAKYNLFVFSHKFSGSITKGEELPIAYYTPDCCGVLCIPMEESVVLSKTDYDILVNVVSTINIVLPTFISNTQLSIKVLNKEILPPQKDIEPVDLTVGNRLQLVVQHEQNTKIFETPLKYESDGIKKIISYLNVLIAVYNNPNITLAIDELDTSVFEYLLGELLDVMKTSAKGQLIFTAHNLRPLEVLDSKSIVFTTINPQNRYVKKSDIKETNNLRNIFLRELALGRGLSTNENEFSTNINMFDIIDAMNKVRAMPHNCISRSH